MTVPVFGGNPFKPPQCESRHEVPANTVRGAVTYRCTLAKWHSSDHHAGPLWWADPDPDAGTDRARCEAVWVGEGDRGLARCMYQVGHDGRHLTWGKHAFDDAQAQRPTPKLDKLMMSTGDLFKARIGEGGTVDETVWRNLYRAGEQVGVMFVADDARQVVERMNSAVNETPGARSDADIDKVVNGLRRKVRTQANEITKLTALRQGEVTQMPEYRELMLNLAAQIELTGRENFFRKDAEGTLARERAKRAELIGNLIYDVRKALGESEPGVPIERATWAELRHQVGRLIRKLDEKPPVLKPAPENTARRDLYRLIGLVGAENWNNRRQLVSVTDLGDVAEGLRGALVKLERRVDDLAKVRDQRDALGLDHGRQAEEILRLRGEVDKLQTHSVELAASNSDLRSIRHQDVAEISKLSDKLADAEAAAGWREKCDGRNRADGQITHRCQRAAGHTGQHNSDVASGEGRQW